MTGSSSSSIRFSCPSCSGRVKVPPGQAGQKCRCPRCDADLIAPAAVAKEESTPDPFSDDEFFSVDAMPPAPASPPASTAPDNALQLQIPESEQNLSWDATIDQTPIPVRMDADDLIDLPLSLDDVLGDNPMPVKGDRTREPIATTPTTAAATPSPPPPTVQNAAPPAVTVAQSHFGLHCGLCGTRVHATLEQVGRELTCPDCHSKIPVRAPKAPPPPSQAVPVYGDGDEYQLSEPVQRPESELVRRVNEASADIPADAKAGGDRGSDRKAAGSKPQGESGGFAGVLPGLDVMAASARSVLEKANAEAEEVDRKRAKLPTRPFVTGVVSFLFDTVAASRWLALTLMLQVVLTLLAFSFSSHIAAVLFSMIAAASALLFLVASSVCFIAILHDTANGYEKIEGWPGLNFLDWMGDSLYVINALFASATPGILLGQIPSCAGAPRFLAFFGGLLTFYALFPLFLLSMSEEGSPLSIASGSVWRSLLTARSLWYRFYLASAGIICAAVIGAAIAAVTSLLISAFVTALVVALTMIYFRLLGRLAWCLSEVGK